MVAWLHPPQYHVERGSLKLCGGFLKSWRVDRILSEWGEEVDEIPK
jgi:hypothetical protein